MIRFEEYPIMAADLGPSNPLPDLKNISYIHADFEMTDRIAEDERAGIGKGMISTILPYKIQDGYNRQRRLRQYRAAILENGYLKAVFLPELGGRLWSLFDKRQNRELLYTNPVFQPANLALRNAWFSGGVEFNVGIKGHNPLTCSPLFAEIEEYKDGTQILNMYEFERIREIVYTVSVCLPENSEMLYLRERIENTSDDNKYVYWWTNIAVPETEGTRIVVPASESFLSSYNEGHYVVDKIPVPYFDGKDMSYPVNSKRAQDFFYKLPDDSPKWIAAVQENGNGLIQVSTGTLFGRKLFLWGQGAGGRNWNEFLSDKGQSYVEIQAGLAHTQLEHLAMNAHDCWEWVEAYGGLACDKERVHAADWETARREVEARLRGRVDLDHADTALYAVFPPRTELVNVLSLQEGSGWGTLENKVRSQKGGEAVSRYCRFPEESLDEEQAPWLYLLKNGCFPLVSPSREPISYVSGDYWLPLVEQAVSHGGGQLWYACLQLGILRYIRGDMDGAKQAWQQSIEAEPSAWAWRNLALLYKNEYDDMQQAMSCILKAVQLNRDCRGLLVDCGMILTEAGEDKRWLSLVEELSEARKADGRIRLLKAIAHIHLYQPEIACEIVNDSFEMCDIQEGEVSVSHIWHQLYSMLVQKQEGIDDPDMIEDIVSRKYPLPQRLDFRMH